MTIPQENQIEQEVAQKQNDKEFNFAQIRQQLERERTEKAALMQEIEKIKKMTQERMTPVEEEDDDEPYVDKKRLRKELSKVAQRASDEAEGKIQSAVNKALADERQRNWMKSNPDFYDIMQHAQSFADRDPELAETILEMPDGFERQKLVYKTIKAMGLHKKEEPKTNIQDKIDQNKRSPYYQPTGVGTAPYANNGDFSPSGQKSAFQKMQELKNRLRI